MREARDYAKIAPNIVVKLPLTTEGLKAVRACAAEEHQDQRHALLLAGPGDPGGQGGGRLHLAVRRPARRHRQRRDASSIRKIVAIYKNYDFKTEVLVASVRRPMHIVEAALLGAHVATVPFAVLKTLLKHPLTDAGLAKFLADWKKIQK